MRTLIGFLTVLYTANGFANTSDRLAVTQQQLTQIQQQTADKQTTQQNLRTKVSTLRLQMQQNAENIQQQERTILQLNRDIMTIQRQQKSLKRLLSTATRQLASLIPIAQNLQKYKNIAIFLSPDTPKRSMMAIGLLQTIMPQIQQKRQLLIDTYNRLSILQAQFADKQADLEQQQQLMRHSTTSLQAKIAAYNATLTRDAKTIANLQQQQHTLQQQIESLQNIPQRVQPLHNRLDNRHIRPQRIRLFPMENTPITPPVAGKIITKFQQPLKNGAVSDGIYIKTLANAQVVAPFDGYVAFVGAFNALGKIVIIAHERGYHTVLIGFNEIYVQNNDWVLEKDPIGTTNTQNTPFKIEIRYGTKVENPLLWIHRYQSRTL